MGRELTNRHALLFEKRIPNPWLFAQDIYRYGKLRELFSFVVWELCHRLRLFPRSKYLQFNGGESIRLKHDDLTSDAFSERIHRFFRTQSLAVERCEHNWKLLHFTGPDTAYGCLYPEDRDLYKSNDNGISIVFINRFPQPIKSLFVSSQNTLFVCVKGTIYRSSDAGDSFQKVLEMGSSESFFRHHNSMTETPDKMLIMGEYGNVWEERRWRKLAYLYFSVDDGKTWTRSDFLIRKGTNKHVHLVKYSRLFEKVYMADGDNYKKLWVSQKLNGSRSLDPDEWIPVNRFHIQMGGYTSVVENDQSLFFGTDYQGGTNFIVETRDGQTFDKKVVPDPYRRSPIANMVQRKSKRGNEIWAYLPYSTANTRCLLMYSMDGGRSWTKVIEYSSATHKIWLVSSSMDVADALYFSIESRKTGERVVYKVADPQ